MTRSLPIDKAMGDCLVAFKMNGEALRQEQGYPLRLVVPGWEGNLWVKWLRRIEVGDKPWYNARGDLEVHDAYERRTLAQFTFFMDAKSVVTSPSPEMPMLAKGRNVLTGIAWSGRGKVTRVDVTLDGGKNWVEARIDGPVFERSLTRFYLDFDWQGQEMMVQSRAHDDTGYVQPTKDELRAVRGLNNITTTTASRPGSCTPNGETENVEIS